MNINIKVENHQPVPLRPVKELLENQNDYQAVIYLGLTVWCENSFQDEMGWGVVNGDNDSIQWFDGDYTFFDILNTDETLARWLQPGEKLIVTYEA